MTPEFIVRPEAEAEVAAAFAWDEDRVIGLGLDFIRNLDNTFLAIIGNPLSYQTVQMNIRRALVRRFPYQVFFVHETNLIVVIAVFHGRREPKHWHH